MGIILSVLQILGIIVMSLLGLGFLTVLLFLFVPIRYVLSGDIHEKVHLEGKIFWMFSFFRAKFSYEDELLYAEIGMLWKKTCISKEFGAEEDTKIPVESKKEDKTKKTIKEKFSYIKKKVKQIKKLIQDQKNRQAAKHLKDEFIHFIKILLPKKSRLNGVFSTGAPDTTGQTYGAICCFPIIYQDNWSLVPDFEAEKAYFKGDFYGKGRIYVFQIVGIWLRIMIDKNCRRLFYILKRLGGRTNGRGK